jgi:hypothetical protein
MIICEFCLQHQGDGKCRLGLNIPKHMGCREFDPGIGKFCSEPTDFTNSNQIIQMATFFGIKGMELKKVKVMALREEKTKTRPKTVFVETDPLNGREQIEYRASVTSNYPSDDETS